MRAQKTPANGNRFTLDRPQACIEGGSIPDVSERYEDYCEANQATKNHRSPIVLHAQKTGNLHEQTVRQPDRKHHRFESY